MTSVAELQRQNQALLEAVNRAAAGDLNLDAMHTAIEAATTSFEVRGYHSQLAAFRHSSTFEALSHDGKEYWWQLVCRCSELDRHFHSLGFQKTGQWDFQDIRVSYLSWEDAHGSNEILN